MCRPCKAVPFGTKTQGVSLGWLVTGLRPCRTTPPEHSVNRDSDDCSYHLLEYCATTQLGTDCARDGIPRKTRVGTIEADLPYLATPIARAPCERQEFFNLMTRRFPFLDNGLQPQFVRSLTQGRAGLAGVALAGGGQCAAVFKVFQWGLQFVQHRFPPADLFVDARRVSPRCLSLSTSPATLRVTSPCLDAENTSGTPPTMISRAASVVSVPLRPTRAASVSQVESLQNQFGLPGCL